MKIELKTDNAAFEESECCEVSRILREFATKYEMGRRPTYLMDINGNKVGKVEY